MRKFLRIFGILVCVIIVCIVCALAYIKFFLPNVGEAPEMHIASTPEKVRRGEYLAKHVMVCMDCHSTRQWNYFAGPMEKTDLGKGGELFDQKMGLPGSVYAANITPAGIGHWTDGEVFRAITTGVRKNGKPLFPLMPYDSYGLLDPEDIEAIICYIRSLPPVNNTLPESKYDFPMNFIVNTIPKKAQLSVRPDSSNVIAYGKYMITAAGCGGCHTPFEKGKFDTSMRFAGGRAFMLPSGIVTTPNLTPDNATGTGTWTKQAFLSKFSAYRDSAFAHRPIDFAKDYATIMPWSVYAGMTDHDLGAIYEYLHSLKPISHKNIAFQKHLN
jgi:hypothetical protein